MASIENFAFLSEVTEATLSSELFNSRSDSLVIEVSGDATDIELNIECCVDMIESVWDVVSVQDKTSLNIVTQINSNGIYEVNMSGISKIRANLVGITSGTIKVFGRLISEEL